MSHTGATLFGLLQGLELAPGDHAVFGSGPLLVRGIIDRANDLDVVCRGQTWELIRSQGDLLSLEAGVEVVALHDQLLTFGTNWRYGPVDVGVVIDTAELIDGLPFARLEHVVAYKVAADRPKDREHLALLRASGAWPGAVQP